MKTFREFCTQNDADLLFEKTVKDAAGDPSKVLDLTYRIKSVPIHTRKTLVPSDLDKVKPTDPEDFLVGEEDDTLGDTYDDGDTVFAGGGYQFGEGDLPANAAIREWAKKSTTQCMFAQAHGTKGRQRLMETAAILAERMGLDEKKSPEEALKVVDKNRQKHGHEPMFFDEPPEEPIYDKEQMAEATHLPSRTQPEIHDIKAKYASKLMTWADAHKELLKRGVPVPEIQKHLGESPVLENHEDDYLKTKKQTPQGASIQKGDKSTRKSGKFVPKPSKADKVMSVLKGKGGKFVKKGQTMLGTPRDVIDTDPTIALSHNRPPL